MLQEYDDAKAEIAVLEKMSPGLPYLQQYRAWILAAEGKREKALKLIELLPRFRYAVTSIYSFLGLNDEAIRYIKTGIETGFEEIGDYMYSYPFLISNPFYKNLRDDPRFEEILEKEKTKYEEKLKKYSKF
jgi:hypothetical protein